jgi:hypothetical protein
VVEGLITDQPGRYTIKVSQSIPLGAKAELRPVTGCNVFIMGGNNNEKLYDIGGGSYITNGSFKGEVGMTYRLKIEIFNLVRTQKVLAHVLQSLPMEMLPVPEIDSLFFKKETIRVEDGFSSPGEGCQIYINTSDPANICKYYRWDYTETWKLETPHYNRTINRNCWITNKSGDINIKSSNDLNINRIENYPVKFISNESDRLAVRYHIRVDQYSVSENEYNYWKDLQNITEETGNLYDIIPSAVVGNMYCVEEPDRVILGYFSVSASRSKMIYIDERFEGLIDLYSRCVEDTTFQQGRPGWPDAAWYSLNGTVFWIVEDMINSAGPKYIITTQDKSCVDCTTRGSLLKPDFWRDEN